METGRRTDALAAVCAELEEALADRYDARAEWSSALVTRGPHAAEAYWDARRDRLEVSVHGNRSGMPLPNVEAAVKAAVDTGRIRREADCLLGRSLWEAEAEEDTRRHLCRLNGWDC